MTMASFAWVGSTDRATGHAGQLKVTCRPMSGLEVIAEKLHLSQILGLEIVDAVNLGPQTLAAPGMIPEMVIRQDTLSVTFNPTTKRPVECVARWRVLSEGIFDLEVSTLTPGKWDDLAVQTCSRFPCHANATVVEIDQSVTPGIVLYRPPGDSVTYVEFCHPHDGIGVTIQKQGDYVVVQQRLFGHDLEKGVILRGRLRGLLVPRAVDVEAARAAFQRFIVEPPNLAL